MTQRQRNEVQMVVNHLMMAIILAQDPDRAYRCCRRLVGLLRQYRALP